MNTDSVRFYFDEIKNIPPLTVKEEKKYGYELLNGSEEARNILIKHNLKLVVAIAKKYIGLGVSFIDMIQDGNEGLLISIDKFDPSKGCLFSTYAAWWIRLRITRAIAANKSTIRVPLHDNDKNKNYQIALDKLSNELNRVPTDSEIAKFMNITIDEIKRIKAYQIEIISLNTLIGNDKENELSEVVSLTEDTPEDITIINNLPNDVRRLLDNCHLTEREISVLVLRYGLDGQNPRTLEEVGIILGNVSKERTRQLEARALKKIRMSAYIKDFAIYMNNPSKAIKRIDDYREQYEESIFNTYKLNIIDDNTKAKNVVKECKTKVRR